MRPTIDAAQVLHTTVIVNVYGTPDESPIGMSANTRSEILNREFNKCSQQAAERFFLQVTSRVSTLVAQTCIRSVNLKAYWYV
eukprot:SAG11_NODE_3212_length_2607_cov_1.360447_2_plen_83_part_00